MDESLCKDSAATLSGGTPEVKAALRTVIVMVRCEVPECLEIDQLKLVRPAPVKGNRKATQSLRRRHPKASQSTSAD
jgi:hypothetical protein